jgi:hypothetical protein
VLDYISASPRGRIQFCILSSKKKDLTLLNYVFNKQLLAWCRWLTSAILAIQKQRSRGSWFDASPRQLVFKTLPQKYPTQRIPGKVAQAVAHLPSKHKALSSNPSTAENKINDYYMN